MAEGTTLKRIQRMNYDLFIYEQNITHYIVLFMNNPSSCGRIPAGNLSHKSNSTMAHLTAPNFVLILQYAI